MAIQPLSTRMNGNVKVEVSGRMLSVMISRTIDDLSPQISSEKVFQDEMFEIERG